MNVTEYTIYEKVYVGPAYELPTDFKGYMQWLSEMFKNIPEKYQSKSRVSFGYDDDKEYVVIEIYYRRPENEKEKEKRLKDKIKSGEDYRLYLKLKERFKGIE